MRRAFKWHDNHKTGREKHPKGEMLNATFGHDLRDHSWNRVKEALLGLTPKELDMNADAAKLARELTKRMPILSRNPEVTARALWLYDRDLCPKLVEALQAHMRDAEEGERELENIAAHASGEE